MSQDLFQQNQEHAQQGAEEQKENLADFSGPLYLGPMPVDRLLEEYVTADPGDDGEEDPKDSAYWAEELEALELFRALQADQNAPDAGQKLARLQELSGQDTHIAIFAVARELLAGTLLPKDEKKAQELLLALCDKKFPAAYAQLVRDVTCDMLAEDAPDADQAAFLRDLVCRGTDLWEPVCALLLARCFLQGQPFTLPHMKVLAKVLLNTAYDGSWDALEAYLRCCFAADPALFPRPQLLEAKDLLRQVCEHNLLPALGTVPMKLYADLCADPAQLTDDWDTPLDKEEASHWYERALEAGDLDAGPGLANLVWETPWPFPLREVRDILAKGLWRDHAPSLATMGRLLWGDSIRGWHAARHHLAAAAALGEPGAYADILWQIVASGDPEGSQKDFARKELVRLAPTCPEARLRLAIYQSGRALGSTRFAAPLPDDADGASLLQECLDSGLAAALVFEAENLFFGSFGRKEDPERALELARLGRAKHQVRASILEFLIRQVLSKELSCDILLRQMDKEQTVFWGEDKKDALAMSLLACLKCGVGYSGLPRATAVHYNSEEERIDHCKDLLELALHKAQSSADVAVFLFLARQFGRSGKRGLAPTLARIVSKLLGAETADPVQCTRLLLALANEFGAAHTGRFAGQPSLAKVRTSKKLRQRRQRARKA